MIFFMIGPIGHTRSFQSSTAYATAALVRQSVRTTANAATGAAGTRYQYATKASETRMSARVWIGSSRPIPSMNETSWGTRYAMRKKTTSMTAVPAIDG